MNFQLTRGQHITFFILGVIVQCFASFDLPWMAAFRGGLLGLSGALLFLAKADGMKASRAVSDSTEEPTKPGA